MALRRIRKELKDINEDPIKNCTVVTVGDDMFKWEAHIVGPANSPYAGGLFVLSIIFPQDYPFKPPKIKYLTKIYNCNITDKGGNGLDILKDNWSPALTISKVILSMQSMLVDPNPDDPKNEEAARLYKKDRALHDVIATNWTHKYAQGPHYIQMTDEQKEKIHSLQRIAPIKADGDLNERYLSIKDNLMNIFGEMLLFYLVLIYDGEHRDKVPKQMVKQFDKDTDKCAIRIKTLIGRTFTIYIKLDENVKSLKALIALRMAFPPEQQRIVFKGKQLDDKRRLSSYGMRDNNCVHVVIRLRG